MMWVIDATPRPIYPRVKAAIPIVQVGVWAAYAAASQISITK